MSIPQKILLRKTNDFEVTSVKNTPNQSLFLGGLTRRNIFISRDHSLIGVIDNFTINLYKIKTLQKIHSFRLVSEEKGKQIEEENSRLEEMLSKIELNDSANTIMLKRKIEREYIQEIEVSPDNRFLASITKFQSPEEPNLTIREISSDKIIFAKSVKNFNMENWPFFQWLTGEPSPIFCYRDKNDLLFFDTEKNADSSGRIVDPIFAHNCSNNRLSPELSNTTFSLKNFSICQPNKRCGVFLKCNERDKPGKVVVFNYPNFDAPIVSKRIAAESVEFKWSTCGSSLLLKSSINTTKSYYMVSKLCLFNLDKNEENHKNHIPAELVKETNTTNINENEEALDSLQKNSTHKTSKNKKSTPQKEQSKSKQKNKNTASKIQPLEQSQEDFAQRMINEIEQMSQVSAAQRGAINKDPPAEKKTKSIEIALSKSTLHDCSFNHKGDKFIVISYDPVRPKLFRTRDGAILHDFTPFKCNKIVWSPSDRFVWIAGVINMAGKMFFYDMDKLKRIGEGQHQGARFYQWSPDSKFFLTASLSPWRRVENGFKVWSFCGKLMADLKIDALYQCCFISDAEAKKDFDPDGLTAEESEFLTRKNPEQNQTKQVSFRVPYHIDIDKVRGSSRGRRGRRGRRGNTWRPTPKKIFGMPTGQKKKEKDAQSKLKK